MGLDLNPKNALVLPVERKIPKEFIADITKKKKKLKLDLAKSLHILDKRLRKQMLPLTSSQDLLISLQLVNQLTYGTTLGKHTILILDLHGLFPTELLSRFSHCNIT